jgi:transcriptional regulator with PAS, ATPase and Fis domain
MSSATRAPFEILFDKERKRWTVQNSPRKENVELALIVEAYRNHEYGRDAICQMLGLEKTALSDRLKQANEIK